VVKRAHLASPNLCRLGPANLALFSDFVDTGATSGRAATHLDFVGHPINFGVVLVKPSQSEDHFALS
jgi:hypothetical protein